MSVKTSLITTRFQSLELEGVTFQDLGTLVNGLVGTRKFPLFEDRPFMIHASFCKDPNSADLRDLM